MSTVVARAFSKGGHCAGCGRRIRAGEEIVKLDTGERGGSTRYGQGLGTWVGLGCCLVPHSGDTA